MRALLPVALVALTTGCYLFSDEPKARKQGEAGLAEEAGGEAAQAAADSSSADPKPAPASTGEGGEGDCPTLLVGLAKGEQVITSSCDPVTVRGAYRLDGGSLRLEPGVELRFEPGASLEVGRDGAAQLIVAGTAEDPVRLVPASEGSAWTGVRLYPRAGGSSLGHAEIVGAGTEARAALTIDANEVEIEGLRLVEATALALELTAEAGGPKLLGTTITGTGEPATGPVARATPAAAAGLLDLQLEPGARVAIGAGDIRAPLEWPANPYQLDGTIRVSGSEDPERPAQLSLAPGTSLGFGPEARIVVGGLSPGILTAAAGPLAPTPGLTRIGEGGSAAELPDLVPSPAAPSPSGPDPDGAEPGLGPDPSLDGGIRLHALADARPGAWAGIHVQAGGQLILRNVELAHGGSRDEGVIVAEGEAKLSVEGCRFRANAVGLDLRDPGLSIEILDGNEFVDTPVALRTLPAHAGRLGPDNRVAPGTRVEVERGRLETDATWDARALTLVLRGDVYVDGGATLTVTPGSSILFGPGVVLGVGYYAEASLDMRGRADAKISLGPWPTAGAAGGIETAPLQPWGGVVLGDHAAKVRFEHVRLRFAAGAGIELRDRADATLVKVDCAGCLAATVAWDCESTIGNIGVSASEGTPTPMSAPSGCK